VLLLGDLASPSASDWTAATSASHCNSGPVAWPVPAVFASAGLTDSYRAAYADPAAHAGTTWSPTVTTNANGQPEPQDRIDYVEYAGPLQVAGAESYHTAAGTWPSDHAAAITLFTLTAPHGSRAPDRGPSGAGSEATPTSHPSPDGEGSSSNAGSTVGSVSVTGRPVVGGTLTATTAGWPAGATFTYQWLASGVPVPGATGASYVPGAAQLGQEVSVRATGADGQRTGTVTVTGPVVGTGTLTHGHLHITGRARVGRTLTVRGGGWAPAPALAYQWYANGKAVKGATSATFKPGRAQRGKHLTVTVVATESGYSTVALAAAATKRVR
jgi:hypothetical protein